MASEVGMSPLQMSELVFNKVQVDVNTEFDENSLEEFHFNNVGVQSEIAVSIKKGQEDHPVDLLVTVRIGILNAKEDFEPCPYNIDVEAQALFSLHSEFECKNRAELVRVNGASMVIGSIREMISLITSRSVFGSITLPSLRITPESQDKATN